MRSHLADLTRQSRLVLLSVRPVPRPATRFDPASMGVGAILTAALFVAAVYCWFSIP